MKKVLLIAMITVLTTIFFLSNQADLTFAEAKKGGIIKMGWVGGSPNFGDPVTFRGPDEWYGSMCIENLTRQSKDMGVVVPSLAVSWELSSDRKSYTFNLRKGVKFHDGTDFNAAAVKWNYDRHINSHSRFLKGISSVEIINNDTVKLHINRWNIMLIGETALTETGMISPTAFKKNDAKWIATHPVGTGPFVIAGYKRAQYVKYRRNENYWDPKRPLIDGLDVYSIPDMMTKVAMMKKGDIDIFREGDAQAITQFQNDKNLKTLSFDGGLMNLTFNSEDPNSIWSDIRMRKALEYAIDKQKIVDGIGMGFSEPLYEIQGGIHKRIDPGTTPRVYNIAKARQLMAEAGHPTLKIKIQVFSKFYGDFLLAIQGQLAEVGIEAEIQKMTSAAWGAVRFEPAKANDLRLDRGRVGTGMIIKGIGETLVTSGGRLKGVKRAEGYDRLFEKVILTEDLKERNALLAEMERLVYNDAMMVPLWTVPGIWVISEDIKTEYNHDDIWFVGGLPVVHFDKVYLDR